MTWPEAMNCPPPDMEAAKRNCPTAELIQSDSVTFLSCRHRDFDVVWLDSAHTSGVVTQEIMAGVAALKPKGIIGGDDYFWGGFNGTEKDGVAKAVQALLPNHLLFFNRLWLSQQ